MVRDIGLIIGQRLPFGEIHIDCALAMSFYNTYLIPLCKIAGVQCGLTW
jgi:hypothetical protein